MTVVRLKLIGAVVYKELEDFVKRLIDCYRILVVFAISWMPVLSQVVHTGLKKLEAT